MPADREWDGASGRVLRRRAPGRLEMDDRLVVRLELPGVDAAGDVVHQLPVGRRGDAARGSGFGRGAAERPKDPICLCECRTCVVDRCVVGHVENRPRRHLMAASTVPAPNARGDIGGCLGAVSTADGNLSRPRNLARPAVRRVAWPRGETSRRQSRRCWSRRARQRFQRRAAPRGGARMEESGPVRDGEAVRRTVNEWRVRPLQVFGAPLERVSDAPDGRDHARLCRIPIEFWARSRRTCSVTLADDCQSDLEHQTASSSSSRVRSSPGLDASSARTSNSSGSDGRVPRRRTQCVCPNGSPVSTPCCAHSRDEHRDWATAGPPRC